MSKEPSPRVIPPPLDLTELGPLVVVEGDCAYFRDGRRSCTAFSLPGHVDGASYQRAMDVGMRRSGTVIYRPLCDGCRKCQPLRIPTAGFVPSRSQRRVRKRCDGLFDITVGKPRLDEERLNLYARYQQDQHGEHAQSADATSYRRFLVDTVTDTIELSWRDKDKKLIGVGVLDVTPAALSSVYFYWDPALRKLSLGIYSALVEIDLCQRWKKSHYYLGYLVPGSQTMSYKASFPGGEVWDGKAWVSLGGRDTSEPVVERRLSIAEASSIESDAARFRLDAARDLNVNDDDGG